MTEPSKPPNNRRVSDKTPKAGAEPIVLKNRIAVLTPDPIAEGAHGKVYLGKILNPVGLLAERIVWGEESPRWLGLEDIPYEEPDRALDHDRQLPVPITDPKTRHKIYGAVDRLWSDYLDRRKQDRLKAEEEFGDILKLLDPMLHEDRVIAVKVLRPPTGVDPDEEPKIIADSVRRFIKENDILRTLRHPTIVRRFGLVRDSRMGWCLLLEYVEGVTLDGYLKKQEGGKLPPAAAARMVRGLADAIRYIHERGVLHRDLKPQNVMVREADQSAVIMDFGIGKWTDESATQQISVAGMRVGTPRYMAPEQARIDGTVTQAVDVYQLCTILFEMVAGRHAYEGMDQQTLFRWLLDPAKRHPTYVHEYVKSISREFEALIEVGRDKDPENRWTIDEFIERLDKIIADEAFEGANPYTSLEREGLTKALQKTRTRMKAIRWEEHLLKTRLHFVDLQARVHEAWNLLAAKAYERAKSVVDTLAKEVHHLPPRYNVLKAEVEQLERAFKMATSRHEAEYLLEIAEQHYAAKRYPDAGAAIDGAAQRLGALPKEGYSDVHKRFKSLHDRYDANHRAFVDLFNAVRKSFIEKIQVRFKDLKEQTAPDAAKIQELLPQVDTAMKSLQTIDREKIGAPAFDKAHKTLFELREKLEKMKKKVGGPA